MSSPGLNVPQKSYGALDNDPMSAKNQLMDQISVNIHKLIESIGIINKYIPKIGTKNDNVQLRSSVQNVERDSTKLITDTHKKVQEMLRTIKRNDKFSQLQGGKLSERFREVVNEYNAVQKTFSSKLKFAPLPKNQGEQQSDNGENFDESKSDVSQMLVHRDLEIDRDVVVDRQIRLQQIEDDVMDVNQIMKELNAMVNQQGESIVTIEDAIDRTAGNLESGTDELFTAYRRQRKRRIRKFICYSVLITIMVMIVLYLVLTPN